MPNERMNREVTIATGRVCDATTSRPVAGLRVEAWEVDGCGDLVAVAVTGARGEFQLSLSNEYLRDLFGDRRPLLFFRVFRGQQLVADTRAGVQWDTRNRGEHLRLCVDVAHPIAGGQPAPLVVRGEVADAIDGPITGV